MTPKTLIIVLPLFRIVFIIATSPYPGQVFISFNLFIVHFAIGLTKSTTTKTANTFTLFMTEILRIIHHKEIYHILNTLLVLLVL